LASFQWSTLAYKAAWDEIFLGEGRARKRDLILGQWDHLGNVGAGEERSFLPIEKFAKGENYLWYSGNHYNADVKLGDDNDGWLNGLYLRALAGDKPYVMGRYDSVRIRVGQAEAMALGGAGTGLNNVPMPCSSSTSPLQKPTRTERWIPIFVRQRIERKVAYNR
jgi:hypothetical protein